MSASLTRTRPGGTAPILQVRGLRKSFARGLARAANRTLAVQHVDLDLYPGDLLAVVGTESAGKTTLLQCIAGYLRPDAGIVTWFGERFTGGGCVPGTAYVAAVPVYYPFLTIRDVLEYRLGKERITGRRRVEVVGQVLDRTQLTGKSEARVLNLNRADLQRLAVAEALASEPAVILVDTSIEGAAGGFPAIPALLEECARGASVIIAARDLSAAGQAATRLLLLDCGRATRSFFAEESRLAATPMQATTEVSGSLFVAERVH